MKQSLPQRILALLLCAGMVAGMLPATVTATETEVVESSEAVLSEAAETTGQDTYTVTFDLGDGSEPRLESVAQGSTVEKPEDPAREGFTFVCWNNGEDEWDFTAPVSGDLSLTAVWQQTEEVQETPEPAASYTVTFDLSDGSEPQTVTAAEGTTVEKPEDPVREGFTFVCWNNDESEWDFSTPVSGDLTLTAVWQEAPAETEAAFTVIFDANGGTNVDAQTVVSGAAAVRPEDPTKEGSIFVCWNNGETEWNFADPVTADLTLTAVWEADPEAQAEEGFVSETHDVFSRIKSTIAPGVTQDIVYAYAKDGKQMVYYVATVDVSRDDVVIQTGYKDQYDNGYGMAKLTEQMAYANTVYSDPERLSQDLCKPPEWCRIEAPHRRF